MYISVLFLYYQALDGLIGYGGHLVYTYLIREIEDSEGGMKCA